MPIEGSETVVGELHLLAESTGGRRNQIDTMLVRRVEEPEVTDAEVEEPDDPEDDERAERRRRKREKKEAAALAAEAPPVPGAGHPADAAAKLSS